MDFRVLRTRKSRPAGLARIAASERNTKSPGLFDKSPFTCKPHAACVKLLNPINPTPVTTPNHAPGAFPVGRVAALLHLVRRHIAARLTPGQVPIVNIWVPNAACRCWADGPVMEAFSTYIIRTA